MPASWAAMSASQQKYKRETIGRWYWGYVRISQKYPRCEGRYFQRTGTQPLVDAFNRLRGHLTRKGVERYRLLQNDCVDFVASTAGQRSKSSGCKWSKLFFRHQARPETFLERRCFYQSQLL